MAEQIGDPGEDTLAGDFIQLLIREGLVKPRPLDAEDWTDWSKGHQVHLRIEALLDELEPHMQRLLPNPRRTSGLTAKWIYRHWSAGNVLVGFGMSPSGLVSPPPGNPDALP